MTKSENLKEQYLKTVKNLEETLKKEETEEIRDSAIKRFELCFDVAWKLLKALLEEMEIKCFSPNECFKEAYQQKIIDYGDLWTVMTKKRNEAVHTYKEEIAEALYRELPKFLKLFQALREKIK